MWMCAKHKEEQAAESLHFTVLQYFEMATDGITYDPKVNYTEMVEADQLLVIDIATNALKTQEKSEKPIYHKDVAQIIKQQLDTAKGGTWNVIVGVSFGSFVTHETKTIIHFFIGSVAFLIWRHG